MLGTSAVIVQPEGEPNLDIQRRLWSMGQCVELWPDVQEVVFGMTNMMVVCHVPILLKEEFFSHLVKTWEKAEPARSKSKVVEIPTTYGGEFAVDIRAVMQRTGLSLPEIAQLHSEPLYDVFAVGSVPGFAYLGGMNPKLFVPRKETPSLSIEKGSLTIGGMQTAISALTGPNGWNSIGFCNIDLFDISKKYPCFLTPGDKVKFIIDKIINI
ncbi:5-oxoprolinase subunit PxpB [Acetobacter senegalensis]|uniref:5-oxoprolinase subunit PxpB n=1 Tax=Acetobacter senegalensis TaxID=446692 RepID=UPI0026507287|nr:5-oxoprolinase subunit PxpB [Acetobacter senegalensis]MDN7351584.1 5-oxoprolinase subunit PxpB [Acetobacter senegalensis]